MTSRRIAVACTLGLAAASISGCWVIDELDRGSELIDKHSPKANEEKQKAAEAAARPAVVAKQDAVAAYFRDEESAGTTKTFTPGSVSEGIVACKLGRATQFMKKEDCGARGGRY